MWSQIEPSAAILCACIVTYRPLFRDIRLPSFITGVKSQETATSDVSRHWPSNGIREKGSEACNGNSEKGSEAGLISNQSRTGRGMSMSAYPNGNSD